MTPRKLVCCLWFISFNHAAELAQNSALVGVICDVIRETEKQKGQFYTKFYTPVSTAPSYERDLRDIVTFLAFSPYVTIYGKSRRLKLIEKLPYS